jgi:hypothetical protein
MGHSAEIVFALPACGLVRADAPVHNPPVIPIANSDPGSLYATMTMPKVLALQYMPPSTLSTNRVIFPAILVRSGLYRCNLDHKSAQICVSSPLTGPAWIANMFHMNLFYRPVYSTFGKYSFCEKSPVRRAPQSPRSGAAGQELRDRAPRCTMTFRPPITAGPDRHNG